MVVVTSAAVAAKTNNRNDHKVSSSQGLEDVIPEVTFSLRRNNILLLSAHCECGLNSHYYKRCSKTRGVTSQGILETRVVTRSR